MIYDPDGAMDRQPIKPLTTRPGIHQELAQASAARRTDLTLTLLGETGRLDLSPAHDRGAVLTDADFGASSDRPPDDRIARTPGGGIVCRDAQLAGATMDRTNWRGTDLSGSDLTGSRARLAHFDEAALERVSFLRADLVGSSFQRASLGEANFREALLEDADLSGAILRFADFSNAILEGAVLSGADLWGAVLDGASLEGANLAGVTLTEASLKGANLQRANLTGANLGRADLTGADLTDADLRGARLGGATLRDALLRNARLEELDLSTVNLTHVHLSGAWLERTLVTPAQIAGVVGEERAGLYAAARRAYLSLQRNFDTLGDGDAASWAYRRRRRMQKLDARQSAGREWRAGRRWPAMLAGGDYLSDQAAELLCDYGESVQRVLAAMLLVCVAFAALYGALEGVVRLAPGAGDPGMVTRSPRDLALFSLLSMAAAGEKGGLGPSGPAAELLVALETFLGVGLVGLMGFVLGNRINR